MLLNLLVVMRIYQGQILEFFFYLNNQPILQPKAVQDQQQLYQCFVLLLFDKVLQNLKYPLLYFLLFFEYLRCQVYRLIF